MADDNGSSSGWSAVESLLGDRYTREARLAPAFLAVFPILLVLLLSFKGLQSAIPALLGLLCVFGVVRWISHIARGIGDKKEIKLFRDWGGKPTTTMMRIALKYVKIGDTKYGDHVRHLLWEAPPGTEIEAVINRRKGQPVPSKKEDKDASESKANPAAGAEKAPPAQGNGGAPDAETNPPAPIAKHVEAKKEVKETFVADALDHLYEPAVAWMRENSRGCPLVVEEEISYGFQRNFFALRHFAFFCAFVSIIAEARMAHLKLQMAWPFVRIDSTIAAVVLWALLFYVAGLIFFVKEKSVMMQGFIYARALLDSFYADAPAAKPAANAKPGNEEAS